MPPFMSSDKDLDLNPLPVHHEWDEESQEVIMVVHLPKTLVSDLQEDVLSGWTLEQNNNVFPRDSKNS